MSIVKFSEVAHRAYTREDRFNTEKIYYVGGEHIDSCELYVTKKGVIKGSTIGPMFYCGFTAGQILFVTRNPHLKKCSIADFDGICSEKTFVIETKDESILTQEYLAIIMQSDDFWNYCEENKSGGVNYFLNWSTLADYEFELPPIKQQLEIAQKVMSAYRLKQSYKKLLDATREMVKSQFIEMFSGAPKVGINNLVDTVWGSSPDSKTYNDIGEGMPFYQGKTEFGDLYINAPVTYCTAPIKMAKANAILMSVRAPVGAVNIATQDCCIGRGLASITPKEGKSTTMFVYYALKYMEADIDRLGTGSTFKAINKESYAKIQMPNAKISEQAKFVSIAEQADKSEFVGCKSQFIEMFKGDNQVPLGDICNIEKGATITRNDVLPGEVPVVAGGQEPSCYHNVANREAGAITVSASGAYAGYINFWNCPIFASDCNTIISKDDEKTDQTFVYFGLRVMQKQIYGLQKGGAQPHVYGKDLQKFMFPCPSYAKQIEFSKMAKQADKSEFVGCKSQFIEMFGTVESYCKLEDLVSDTFPGEWGSEPTSENAIKVIRTTNFTNEGHLDLADVVTRDIEPKKVARKKLKQGDTILERSGGTKDNPVGRVVFFDEIGDYLLNNFTQALRPKESVNPVYLFYALYNSYNINKAAMRAMASQTTGIQNLSMSDFMSKSIVLPSRDEQNKFEQIYRQADKSEFELRKSIEAIDQVIKSLINN